MQITNLATSLSFKVAGSFVLFLPFPLSDQALVHFPSVPFQEPWMLLFPEPGPPGALTLPVSGETYTLQIKNARNETSGLYNSRDSTTMQGAGRRISELWPLLIPEQPSFHQLCGLKFPVNFFFKRKGLKAPSLLHHVRTSSFYPQGPPLSGPFPLVVG